MGSISGSAAVEIDAPVESVYAVAADTEGVTRWQPEIKVAECLERDADGNQLLVRIESETPIKRLVSVLRYSYRASERITWAQEDGDMKSVEGSWRFEEVDGLTRATYELVVDPGRILGMAMRGPVVDLLRARMVDTMPGKLKAFLEAPGG